MAEDQEKLVIDGEEIPFTAEEYDKVLTALDEALDEEAEADAAADRVEKAAVEEADREDEIAGLDDVFEEIKNAYT